MAKNPSIQNEVSIRLELQADCFAGIWAGELSSEGVILKNEIGQAIDAAESVGDDRIQKKISGRVDPESWTHGSSADRKKWFETGYEQRSINACDTFSN